MNIVFKMSLVTHETHDKPCDFDYSRYPAFTVSKQIQKTETWKRDGTCDRRFDAQNYEKLKQVKRKINRVNNYRGESECFEFS